MFTNDGRITFAKAVAYFRWMKRQWELQGNHSVNPSHAGLFGEKPESSYIFTSYDALMTFNLISFCMEYTNQFIPRSQRHGCWYHGTVSDQGINNHAIYLNILTYSYSSP